MKLNDHQQELQKGLRKFCADKIDPIVGVDEVAESFRMEIYHQLGEFGVTGMIIPEELGGMGLTYQDYTLVLRELARSSVSYAVTLSVSTMVQSIILRFGNQKQKEKFLPPLASGAAIGAFALTEPGSGSDASSLSTSAKKVDGGYLLQGSKIFITSAGIAKFYVVFARTGGDGHRGISAFLLEDPSPGLSFGKKEKKMGWKISPTREVVFDQCFVPDENLLGKAGTGFKIALTGLDGGRLGVGAISVGLSERALEESVRFSLLRKQFRAPIFDFQGLQFMLADMATEIEASKLMVEEAARRIDHGEIDTKLLSMTKLKTSDTAMKVTTDAVQIFGGVGYTSEYPVERLMRDAKVLQIVEGTNQIQRVVIAKHLRKEFS